MDTDDVLVLSRVRRLTTTGAARSIRLAAGLSEAEVGAAVGTSAPTVSRWERGERAPRGELGVAYGRLLDRLLAAST